MNHNLIGVDPSIISTGLVVNGKVFNYCRESAAVTKLGGYTKWFEMCKGEITYRYINLDYAEGYSENEVQKLRLYNVVSDQILADIRAELVPDLPIRVAIEGFSYSSTGDIIDLVTFSTLLRNKLLMLTDDITVLSPMSLKMESCKMTYEPKNVGKKKEKLEWRNNEGLAGGAFTKSEMYLAIVENDGLDDAYCTFLKKNKADIISTKTIKKPLEDCNDAYLLYLYLRRTTLSSSST